MDAGTQGGPRACDCIAGCIFHACIRQGHGDLAINCRRNGSGIAARVGGILRGSAGDGGGGRGDVDVGSGERAISRSR